VVERGTGIGVGKESDECDAGPSGGQSVRKRIKERRRSTVFVEQQWNIRTEQTREFGEVGGGGDR